MDAQRDDGVPVGRLGYQPALDGVRALAVVLVLLFHQGFSWMSGGYVGVSVFFTLSGFLITSLLVQEHAAHGRISPSAFYARRLKRLLPASAVCLVAVCLLAATNTLPTSSRLRGDVAAAALQVYNWRALFSGTSYAQLLGAQGGDGLVAHFWSLSIEEQFYWVWPFAMAGLFAVARRPSTRRMVITAVTAVSCTAPWLIASHWGGNAAYWSTPARLAEILIGATLAVWVGRLPAWIPYRLLSFVGFGVVLWAAISWPRSTGPAYSGALPLFALGSAALVLGLQRPGPIAAACSWRPLVALGRVSFGVYLYHWPVFLVIDSALTGLTGGALFGLRAAVTLAVSLLSYFMLERPIRHARTVPVRTFVVSATAVVVVVAVGVVVPVRSADELTFAPLPSIHGFDALPAVESGATVPGSVSATTRPTRILVAGDSTAFTLALGLLDWASAHPTLLQLESVARPGCGLMVGSKLAGDTDGAFRRSCDNALGPDLDTVFQHATPDIAVVLITLPDTVERIDDISGRHLLPTDADYAAQRLRDYRSFVDDLVARGVRHIVWLLAASPAPWYYSTHPDQPWGHVDSDLIDATVRQLSEPQLCVIDFGADVLRREAAGDTGLRKDGLHVSQENWLTELDGDFGRMLLAAARGSCP